MQLPFRAWPGCSPSGHPSRPRQDLPRDTMGIIDRSTLDKARQTGTLYLSHMNLKVIPEEVFTLTNLVRLDLGWNHLEEISPRIGELAKLEELWLNRNPLKNLPSELESCVKLKILYLRDTKLRKIPNEVGRLRHLMEVDLQGTTLKPKQQVVFDEGGTYKLLAHLRTETSASRQK